MAASFGSATLRHSAMEPGGRRDAVRGNCAIGLQRWLRTLRRKARRQIRLDRCRRPHLRFRRPSLHRGRSHCRPIRDGSIPISKAASAASIRMAPSVPSPEPAACRSELPPGGLALQAIFHNPEALAVDSSGNVFFAESGANRVQEITAAGQFLTVAGSDSAPPGEDAACYSPAGADVLSAPSGVAVDAAGNLYISDTGRHRILRRTPEGTIATIAGTGTPGQTGDGGPAVDAEISSPASIALKPDGSIYFVTYFLNQLHAAAHSHRRHHRNACSAAGDWRRCGGFRRRFDSEWLPLVQRSGGRRVLSPDGGRQHLCGRP